MSSKYLWIDFEGLYYVKSQSVFQLAAGPCHKNCNNCKNTKIFVLNSGSEKLRINPYFERHLACMRACMYVFI